MRKRREETAATETVDDVYEIKDMNEMDQIRTMFMFWA